MVSSDKTKFKIGYVIGKGDSFGFQEDNYPTTRTSVLIEDLDIPGDAKIMAESLVFGMRA